MPTDPELCEMYMKYSRVCAWRLCVSVCVDVCMACVDVCLTCVGVRDIVLTYTSTEYASTSWNIQNIIN